MSSIEVAASEIWTVNPPTPGLRTLIWIQRVHRDCVQGLVAYAEYSATQRCRIVTDAAPYSLAIDTQMPLHALRESLHERVGRFDGPLPEQTGPMLTSRHDMRWNEQAAIARRASAVACEHLEHWEHHATHRGCIAGPLG